MAKPTNIKINKKLEKFFILLTFFAAFAGIGFTQTSTSGKTSTRTVVTTTATPVTPMPPRRTYNPMPMPTPPRRTSPRQTMNTSGIPAEKSIAVDAKANVELCVNSGNLKINGWNRNEVRAMVENGSYVGFKVLNKTVENNPAYLKVLGYDPVKGMGVECLSGENIELDVPHGAILKVGGRQYEAEISSIYKAEVKNNSGSIVLNDISQGINAQTFEGDVRVEDSGGQITLNTVAGNIFAFNAKSNEFSNIFFAKTTSGAIKLQAIEYPQIDTKSITGKIDFTGNILNNGQYKFDTQNGSILLNISPQSSFAMTATYISGNFQTDLTMTNVVKIPGPPQKLTGQIGNGNATVKLNTYNGSIYINRKEP